MTSYWFRRGLSPLSIHDDVVTMVVAAFNPDDELVAHALRMFIKELEDAKLDTVDDSIQVELKDGDDDFFVRNGKYIVFSAKIGPIKKLKDQEPIPRPHEWPTSLRELIVDMIGELPTHDIEPSPLPDLKAMDKAAEWAYRAYKEGYGNGRDDEAGNDDIPQSLR